jgi:hypothetical protein
MNLKSQIQVIPVLALFGPRQSVQAGSSVATLEEQAWLRCLAPANSFAEYAPEPNPATGKKDVVWFALKVDRPLFAFAGIWTEFKGGPRDEVEAHSRPSPGLRIVDDSAERGRRADTSPGNAGDLDD